MYSTFSFSCENISQRNKHSYIEENIKFILCELTKESFKDLQDINIEILNINEPILLKKFSKDRISFLSYFRPGISPLRNKYFIGYNPTKIEKNKLSNDEKISVLAHELAHTVQWRKMRYDTKRLYESVRMELDFQGKKSFESTADRIAIKRGLKSGIPYTDGLISYRATNLQNTERESDKEYLIKLYNFSESLRNIENELSEDL